MRNAINKHIASGGTAMELIMLITSLVLFILAALMAFSFITATATVNPVALMASGLASLVASILV